MKIVALQAPFLTVNHDLNFILVKNNAPFFFVNLIERKEKKRKEKKKKRRKIQWLHEALNGHTLLRVSPFSIYYLPYG